jgi:hypothetical protein
MAALEGIYCWVVFESRVLLTVHFHDVITPSSFVSWMISHYHGARVFESVRAVLPFSDDLARIVRETIRNTTSR